MIVFDTQVVTLGVADPDISDAHTLTLELSSGLPPPIWITISGLSITFAPDANDQEALYNLVATVKDNNASGASNGLLSDSCTILLSVSELLNSAPSIDDGFDPMTITAFTT